MQEKKNGTTRPQSARFSNKPTESKSGTFSKKQLKIFTLHYKGKTSTESKFFQAVVKGKIEKVQSAIKGNKVIYFSPIIFCFEISNAISQVDISCRDIDTHETPLHVAAFIGHRELLDILIRKYIEILLTVTFDLINLSQKVEPTWMLVTCSATQHYIKQ